MSEEVSATIDEWAQVSRTLTQIGHVSRPFIVGAQALSRQESTRRSGLLDHNSDVMAVDRMGGQFAS